MKNKSRTGLPICLWLLISPLGFAIAQTAPQVEQIIERLDRLESENRSLREEVRQLREQILPPSAEEKLEERVAIVERRTDEQAQVKVEASQRFPVRLTGMALVNSFFNSKQNGGADNPTVASLARAGAVGGATWRQSVLGLEYRGPETFGGGKIRGSLFMDFFGGSNQQLNHLLRIRTATFAVDWNNTSFVVAQDKPIFSPREPSSLAQVGVAPLTGSGNLWLWEPQVKIEHTLHFGEHSDFLAQVGVVQTTENAASVPAQFAASLERYRPGLEGRFQFGHSLGAGRRIEIAPAFHLSTTHVAAASVPSNLFSVDWLVSPWRLVEFTGFIYGGKNLANFGTGLRQGFTILDARNAIAVHGRGGWAQLKLVATDRLSFNLLAGQHDDRGSDLRFTGIGKNQSYGANLFYKLAPNVIVSFETLQVRTAYFGPGNRLNNHYDLAFAYLF